MYTDQQQETLAYFKKNAEQWERKATVDSVKNVNIIKQRNEYVLSIIDQHIGFANKPIKMLDVGCGSGDLVLEVANRNKQIDVIGVDFAQEMIRIAEKRLLDLNVTRAKVHCCSIFDYDQINDERYDIISANGFIEYISRHELGLFLEFLSRRLKDNGLIVLGSRNRLFNMFSLNQFTLDEINLGNANKLLLEAIALTNGVPFSDMIEQGLGKLNNTELKQLNTGINVSIRYQYTPVELAILLKEYGFATEKVSPIHIHGVPPKFKENFPSIHTAISNLLQEYAEENMMLLPVASTFMLSAKKDTRVLCK